MEWRVHPDKILNYLLQEPGKSRFFLRAGYRRQAWEVLRDDLLRHPTMADVEGTDDNEWGLKVTHRCQLPTAPNGKDYCIRTVWQQKADGCFWLLTAYPR